MQMLANLPWYGYIILIVAAGSYLYRFFMKGKAFWEAPELEEAKFKVDPNSNLNKQQLFSLALDAVTNEWWKVNTNTLTFKKGIQANNYLEGWGINTKDGYWGMTNHFINDGRRMYFDFIYNMMNTQAEENWDNLVDQQFGDNGRALRYLSLLRTGKVQQTLKSQAVITFDSELEIGVVAYDSSVLVGQARRAYTEGIITEGEAWKVINFATQLAIDNFSSWEEFGKSYILGFALDIRDRKDGHLEEMYHMYKQVLENPKSSWNTIDWPQA